MKKSALVIMILLFTVLVGCRQQDEKEEITVEYDYFDHIDHWDDLSEVEDGLVIIYYYSPYCQTCKSIEQDVLPNAYKIDQHIPVYLIEAGMIIDQGEPDFEVPGTPSLIILENRELKEFQDGPINVVDYLETKAEEY